MLPEIFITCSVTGNLTNPEHAPHLPITPQEIADSCLEAAEAGAAIAHIHVRYPDGKPSMEVEHYREVVNLIRAKNDDLILNLTTGPGGRYHPSDEDPAIAGPRTSIKRPELRVEHIVALKPDIATLDLNTMNSGREVVINTPQNVKIMAELINDSDVKAELELFDTGDIHLAHDLLKVGVLKNPALCTLISGVKYGLPSTADAMGFASRSLPAGSTWTGIGVGRMAFPMAVQSYLLGGHVRIGMEDTTYLAKGVHAKSNAELIEKVRHLIEALGGKIASAGRARQMIGLAQ
ncbi:MAG: NADPH:quinone reductase [Hyphomicrobiales bacterium]|nr:MAG: NADPH:quinone reductase [Hyphomicrobiales bacterium]